METGEQKALADIATFGCHIIHVLEEGDFPPFSYSLGIEGSSRAPELLVIGLKRDLAHSIINCYNSRIRSGEIFTAGELYQDFIEGFRCQMRVVHPSYHKEYLGWCMWLYGGAAFRVFQLVYPTTEGVWPWEEAATDWFRARQLLLDQPRSDAGALE